MGILLESERSRETFFQSISEMSNESKKAKKYAIQDFDDYCAEKYKIRNCDEVIQQMKTDGEIATYNVLQNWINSMSLRNPKQRFGHLKDYLYYMGIKLSPQDIKHNLRFQKKLKREHYALTRSEIIDIITPVPFAKKGLYLALLSSGMRVGEALQIRRRDIEIGDRIKITIPAEYTKTGVGRVTWMSKEAARYNIKRIRGLLDNELVWGSETAKSLKYNVANEGKLFGIYADNAKLGMRYSSGTRKITLHSFRSYFITKGNSVNFGFSHSLAGHEYYMKQYNRYTHEQLLEKYLEIEPELAIFDDTKKDIESKQQSTLIKQLQDEVGELEKKNAEFNQLKEELKKREEKAEMERQLENRALQEDVKRMNEKIEKMKNQFRKK